MTKYVKSSANTLDVYADNSIEITDNLPVGVYQVCMTPQERFYLKKIEDFTIPQKIYSDALTRAERILNTFNVRENSTGALFVGEKGSGKTLLSKIISLKAANQGIPTIVIGDGFVGDGFNAFIQSINQPCIMIFDEFEKNYKPESQEKILTLFDGIYQSKKLFILTANNAYKLDMNIINRPGRVYYHIIYKGLSIEEIESFCNDNLVNKNFTKNILDLINFYSSFNFDMLNALVHEVNLYNEHPMTAISMLNIKTR